ncbi:hypothetical protein GGR52DRAFT_545153 [Hypoxylon sp. FL1284]|nr:hypothetical protein GGR52DRAFT_545153 [Hypoxylon sp. FL1284]
MMNRRGGARIPSRRIPLVAPPPQEPPTVTTSYDVTPQDVTQVKEMLAKARDLPPELVDMIIDRAEYWACSVASVDYHKHHLSVKGGREGENKFLLRTAPLGLNWSPASQDMWRVESEPKELQQEYPPSELEKLIERPARWSGHNADHGTYRNSFTWFDAGLERFDMSNICPPNCPDHLNNGDSESTSAIPTCAVRPVWPPVESDDYRNPKVQYQHELLPDEDHLIQRNKHAEKSWQHHHVEWSWDDDIDPDGADSSAVQELEDAGRGVGTGNGEFVKNLKYGDMITVWGRARFPGWSNNIQKVEVKVYWAL